MASDFVTIQDGPTTLLWGGDIDATIKFDAHGVDPGKRAVVSFVVEPSPAGADNDVHLEMDLNGTTISTLSFGSTQGRALQEIVEANLLKETDNKLKLTLTDADRDGSIKVRDLVALYALA